MATRTTKRNRYGNLNGYEGGKRVVEFNGRDIDPFTAAEARAEAAWLAGRDDWYEAAWE